MVKSQFSDFIKKDVSDKKYINDNEQLRLENKKILKDIIGKKIIIESSHSKNKREYFVDRIEDAYIDGNQGLIPAFRLVNNSTPADKHILLNYPRVLIEQDELIDGKKFLLLEYDAELNIVKAFKHLHKPNREPLLIYIYY